MKRYASCYCRYSSDNQQQQSIDYQLERINEFCKKHNIELVEQYIDEATTGTSDNRESFQRMIEDSKDSKWNYLLVYNLSRLARNVEDQMYYQKILKQQGVLIVSVEEKFESTPEGNLFSLITAGINEYYSKHLAKRSFAGVMQNAKKGLATGGVPPLGYDVDKDKRYVINKKEAESVKIIFDKTIEGWTYREIAEYLNKNGYKSKRGNEFTPYFFDTLRNRKYTGEYIFNYSNKSKSKGVRDERANDEDEMIIIPNGMPQIIDKKTFNRVQYILRSKSKSQRLKFKPSKYLLTGILRCEKCERPFHGSTTYNKSNKHMYMTYTHKGYTHEDCDVKSIPLVAIDSWITEEVIPEFLIVRNADVTVKPMNEQILEEQRRVKAEIKELEVLENEMKQEILEKQIAMSKLSFSLFHEEDLNELKRKQQNLRRRIRRKAGKLSLLNKIFVNALKDTIRKYKIMWTDKYDNEIKDRVIKQLISKITISNDEIIVYTNYDVITNKMYNFDISIASIKRDNFIGIYKGFL